LTEGLSQGGLFKFNNLSLKFHRLPFSDFTSFPQFDNPIHLHASFARNNFRHPSTAAQAGDLQELYQFDVSILQLKLHNHTSAFLSMIIAHRPPAITGAALKKNFSTPCRRIGTGKVIYTDLFLSVTHFLPSTPADEKIFASAMLRGAPKNW
jgi:hypothetical protein